MAKHDRRKRSPTPKLANGHDSGAAAVLGVLNGVREAFHGLCIKTGMQVLEAMMEGDREDLCGPIRRGRRGAAGRGQSTPAKLRRLRVARRRRELPMSAATDPLEHTLRGRRRGVDAAVCGHVGPGAGRGGGAGNVEQRGVSAVRGAVSQAPAVVSADGPGWSSTARSSGLHSVARSQPRLKERAAAAFSDSRGLPISDDCLNAARTRGGLRQGVIVTGPRGAGAEAIGGFTGARPPRRGGVHPGGPRCDRLTSR